MVGNTAMTGHAQDERWLPIPGAEGFYSVSELGRVRSEPPEPKSEADGGRSAGNQEGVPGAESGGVGRRTWSLGDGHFTCRERQEVGDGFGLKRNGG